MERRLFLDTGCLKCVFLEFQIAVPPYFGWEMGIQKVSNDAILG